MGTPFEQNNADSPVPAPSAGELPATDELLECPLCGYDLRGLPSQPGTRCPECGHAFDLEAIRQAKREGSDWAFENAQRHVLRKFFKTSFRSLWPVSFWRQMRPTHPVVPGRLRVFGMTWFGVIVPAVVTLFMLRAVAIYKQMHTQIPLGWGRTLTNGSWTLTELPPGSTIPYYSQYGLNDFTYIDAIRMSLKSDWPFAIAANSLSTAFLSGSTVTVGLYVLAWPFVALGAIYLFGITLRRAGIRSGHVWRCVVYPIPLLVLSVPLTLAASIPFANVLSGIPYTSLIVLEMFGITRATIGLFLMVVLLSTFHVVCAHVQYLRLPHALAQALLVQVVTWLVILTAAHGVLAAMR
jgi:hypothetical protein